MAAHPGVPLGRQQVASLRPATAAAALPAVKVPPPAKPATPMMGKPANQPAANERPVAPAQPTRAPAAQPAPNPREANRPEENRSAPAPSRPEPTKPAEPPARTERPPAVQPAPNRPEPARPAPAPA